MHSRTSSLFISFHAFGTFRPKAIFFKYGLVVSQRLESADSIGLGGKTPSNSNWNAGSTLKTTERCSKVGTRGKQVLIVVMGYSESMES